MARFTVETEYTVRIKGEKVRLTEFPDTRRFGGKTFGLYNGGSYKPFIVKEANELRKKHGWRVRIAPAKSPQTGATLWLAYVNKGT